MIKIDVFLIMFYLISGDLLHKRTEYEFDPYDIFE